MPLQTSEAHDRYRILRNCRDAPSLYPLISALITSTIDRARSCLVQKHSFSLFKNRAVVFPIGSETEQQKSIVWNSGSSPTSLSNGSYQNATEATEPEYTAPLLSNLDLPLKEELGVIFERHFRFCMTSQGHASQNSKDSLLDQAIAQMTSGSVWDTSHPIAAALCKKWCHSIIIVYTAFLLLCLTNVLKISLQDNAVSGHHYKYSLHSAEKRQFLDFFLNNSEINYMGLLMNGCEIELPKSCHLSQGMRTMTLSCAESILMNGWWFETSKTAMNLSYSARFSLEVCDVSELYKCTKWTKIGSSSVAWIWWGKPIMTDGWYLINQRSRFDLSVPWMWPLSNICTCVAEVTVCVFLLLILIKKDRMRTKTVIWVGCCVVSAIQLMSSVGYYLTMHPALAFFSAGNALFYCGLAMVTKLSEHLFRHFCAFAGIGLISWQAIHNYAFFRDYQVNYFDESALQNPFFVIPVPLLLFSIVSTVSRFHSRFMAQRIVSDDQQ